MGRRIAVDLLPMHLGQIAKREDLGRSTPGHASGEFTHIVDSRDNHGAAPPLANLTSFRLSTMFYPATAMDPRIHSRGYKRKRQQGETFGLCDARCAPNHQPTGVGQGSGQAGQASVAIERNPDSVPNYVSEVAEVGKKNAQFASQR